MAEDSKELGRTIRWKVKEYSHGLMEEDTKVSMLMTRKKEREHFSGLMAENTKVPGQMESNTVLEFIQVPPEKPKKENGPKERESLGFEKFYICRNIY